MKTDFFSSRSGLYWMYQGLRQLGLQRLEPMARRAGNALQVFEFFHICWWVKKYATNARCKIPLASQRYHNHHFISFSTHFHWHQQCWPGPRKTVGWTPILNAPTRTSTSRSTKTGQIQRFWVTRPSLTSSSATTVEANIRNNLNFKITS